jgi:hypothetical protein
MALGILLVLHVVLLALASTNFTVVTGWATGSFGWNYLSYSYQDGWGYIYHSQFSLAVVITYLLAYLAGTLAYAMLWSRGAPFCGFLGIALSIVGLASFALEASHWVFVYNLSWIASAPAVMFPLAAVAAFQMWVTRKQPAEDFH